MGPLDGIRAKLARAEEHILTLDREAQSFLRSNPPPYEITGEHRDDAREYAYVVRRVANVPPRFAVIAGDAIHNMRSTLDHLTYALVVCNGGTPTTQTQFPVCSSEEKFREALARGRIKGVSGRVEKKIKSLQPFNNDTSDDTVLAVLNDFSIVDKHRLPVVTATAVQLGHQIVFRDAPRYEGAKRNVTVIAMPDHTKQPWALTKVGEALFSLRFEEPAPHVVADIEFSVQVAFERAGRVRYLPAVDALRLMLGATREAIKRFETEFEVS
jgi:hypothetical protein